MLYCILLTNVMTSQLFISVSHTEVKPSTLLYSTQKNIIYITLNHNFASEGFTMFMWRCLSPDKRVPQCFSVLFAKVRFVYLLTVMSQVQI